MVPAQSLAASLRTPQGYKCIPTDGLLEEAPSALQLVMDISAICSPKNRCGLWLTFCNLITALWLAEAAMFDENYRVSWGNVQILNNGQLAELTMDESSGSGFQSKLEYLYGSASMRIKLVSGDSAGIVTAFYMGSAESYHDELDFEFLGNVSGQPILLQTNVFADGIGNREQRIQLWFDPTEDFHNYSILWNQHQTVFWVDNIPIRVFRNNEKSVGVGYPKTRMTIFSTLWNGQDWATNGGMTKINWSLAPFIASFELFQVDGCAFSSSSATSCEGGNHWWDRPGLQSLTAEELRELNWVKRKYMIYDYCTDETRHASTPPECALNP